jgi:hypothetical protein
MTKTYTVNHGPTWWECQIEVSDDPETVSKIQEAVEFWEGCEFRLLENNKDYLKTYLQQLARQIIYLMTEHDYSLEGIIDELSKKEGWYIVDGNHGIKILAADDFDFNHSDFEVMEDPQP